MRCTSKRGAGMRWTPFLLLALAVPGFTEAQQRRPGERPERNRMEEQVRQRFQQMVIRELGLDQDTGEELDRVVEAFHEPRRELAMRQRQLQRRMSRTGVLLQEREAEDVLAEMATIKREEAELLAREQEALLRILNPPQVVRLYTLREELGRRIRQLREGRPGGPPGMPGFPLH